MLNIPDTEKKIKARISSYKSSLNKELKNHGCISDGSGKRYLLFVLYFALGDLTKFDEYIIWYRKTFPDDMGEPIQKLCGALGLHRMAKEPEAQQMLAEAMLSNLYILPYLLGEKVEQHDIWHASNYEYADYCRYVPEELIALINKEDLAWIKKLTQSAVFCHIKQRYIEIYQQLKYAETVRERTALLNEASDIINSCLES